MASSAPDHLRTPGLISNRPCYEGIKTWFGYWRDDGFETTKHLGRIDLNQRWTGIRNQWVTAYRNRAIVQSQSVMSEVTAEDEWCAEAYMDTDYSVLATSDFENEIKQYVAYRILNEIGSAPRSRNSGSVVV